jgi:hypothetical protein
VSDWLHSGVLSAKKAWRNCGYGVQTRTYGLLYTRSSGADTTHNRRVMNSRPVIIRPAKPCQKHLLWHVMPWVSNFRKKSNTYSMRSSAGRFSIMQQWKRGVFYEFRAKML